MARTLGRLALLDYLTELTEVITLARQEKIRMLVEHLPLQRANDAYQLLPDGRIKDASSSPPNRRSRRPRTPPPPTERHEADQVTMDM
ncbi:hypothetical protein [Streptomyces olivaceoviridis]|uniref:hypothetical protein n=1 Tax=Streptomyces olivaceoviridis TaxID=1921 RepID=UPI0036F7037D